MSNTTIPKDGYYIARVQLDTGGDWTLYVRVKDGKQMTTLGVELLPDACSEFNEVNLGQMVRVWPEDAAMELQALRTANAGLVAKVKRLEEAGDGLRKASRVFLLSFVDDDYGADDGTPIDRVDPDASVQWEDPPTAGEHVQLQNAINKWNQAKGQP